MDQRIPVPKFKTVGSDMKEACNMSSADMNRLVEQSNAMSKIMKDSGSPGYSRARQRTSGLKQQMTAQKDQQKKRTSSLSNFFSCCSQPNMGKQRSNRAQPNNVQRKIQLNNTSQKSRKLK